MKTLLTLISSLLACATSFAGNIFFNSNYAEYEALVKELNREQTGNSDFPTLSRQPKDFTPVYIWHYGRHGSRYHYSQDDYTYIYNELRTADSLNNLTDFGKKLFADITKIYDDAHLRAGDLTPQGAKQHKGIARRMAENFPNLFRAGARIEAQSSTSVRCVLSMNAFLNQLHAQVPEIMISADASKRNMNYICPSKEIGEAKMPKNSLDKFYANREYKGGLFAKIFVKEPSLDKENFIRVLYYMLITLQGVDIKNMDEQKCSLTELFTEQEMEHLWEKQNIYWYNDFANSPINGGAGKNSAKILLMKLIEEADFALLNNRPTANLKFGHDTALLSLVCLMNLDNLGASYSDFDNLSLHWQEYRAIPMAGNLQVIFYVNYRGTDETPKLVKFLLNEREVRLPIKAYEGNYYSWDDVRNYFLTLAK